MAHDHAHAHGEAGHGPKTGLYLITAVILTIITAVEVWIFFIPAIKDSAAFIPILLVLSAVKFAAVVMLYMHLKYDNKLFTQLFTGPLIIAGCTMLALMFLFGQMKL